MLRVGDFPPFAAGIRADMRLLKPSQPESPRSGPYQVFRGPGDDFADETRRIGVLINAWLESQDDSPPGSQAVRRIERKLHVAIKASPLFGKILSFAGLNFCGERPDAGRSSCYARINKYMRGKSR